MKIVVFPELTWQDLDRDIALKRLLVRLVDGAHATLGNEREHIVGGEKLVKFFRAGSLELGRIGHTYGRSVQTAATRAEHVP